MGLGLSIARAVARQHGGDILLQPNNPGLRAIISLPQEGPCEGVLQGEQTNEASAVCQACGAAT